MESNVSGKDEEQLRDHLARERTRLANERTLLAYLRTAIMLAATGGTLLTLYSERMVPSLFGWTLIAASIAVAGIGTMRFQKLAREL